MGFVDKTAAFLNPGGDDLFAAIWHVGEPCVISVIVPKGCPGALLGSLRFCRGCVVPLTEVSCTRHGFCSGAPWTARKAAGG